MRETQGTVNMSQKMKQILIHGQGMKFMRQALLGLWTMNSIFYFLIFLFFLISSLFYLGLELSHDVTVTVTTVTQSHDIEKDIEGFRSK